MVEIQATNNIVFLTTPSLKNVTTSSTNEFFFNIQEIWQNKPINFHSVPKLIIDYKELMFKLLYVHKGRFVH